MNLSTDFIDERILIILPENDRQLLKETLLKYNQVLSDECDFDNHEYLSYVNDEWFTDNDFYGNPETVQVLTQHALEQYLFKNTIANTVKFP